MLLLIVLSRATSYAPEHCVYAVLTMGCIFQMVGPTRNTPSGFGGASGSGSQQPPPPPNFGEFLAAQTELLRQLVQGQQQQQRGGHHVHQPQAASYQDFLGTQPPLFNKTKEPLDADAWIQTIESKFALLMAPCSEANEARFTAQ